MDVHSAIRAAACQALYVSACHAHAALEFLALESYALPRVSNESASVLSTAMNLSASEREEVATALWDSLNLEEGLADSADSELLAEADKRRGEIRSGEVAPITHDELKQQLGL